MKNKKNKKSILGGIVLIIFAVCILLDRMGALPNIPILKLGVLLLLVLVFFDSIRKLEFIGMAIPVGIGGWMFRNELGLSAVPGYLILVVAVLIGIGLTMIFGTRKKDWLQHFGGKKFKGDSLSSYYEEEGSFDIDNNFNAKTEYVNIKNIRRGKIDNALGQLTVYLNGSTIDPAGATIDMDNGLGNLIVFIPKEFRVKFKTENGLGNIDIHGEGSKDENEPIVYINLDNGLGKVDIYFE